MSIIKNGDSENYTILRNTHLRDKDLSFKAKGLLSVMFSLPNDWNFSTKGLTTMSNDGETSVRSALKELEEHKYLIRKQIRNDKGMIVDWEYVIFEMPYEESQIDYPYVENQHMRNRTQYNTNIQNTNIYNTKRYYYKEIVDLYNEICIKLPKVAKLTNSRKKTINARYKEYESIDVFKELFNKANSSEFLCGDNNRNWKANFDWLLNEQNMAKVLEDRYKNKETKKEVIEATW